MRLLILAMMLILAVTIAAPAEAQTSTPTPTNTPAPGSWVEDFDFTTGQHGWTAFPGSQYVAGVGFTQTGSGENTCSWSGGTESLRNSWNCAAAMFDPGTIPSGYINTSSDYLVSVNMWFTVTSGYMGVQGEGANRVFWITNGVTYSSGSYTRSWSGTWSYLNSSDFIFGMHGSNGYFQGATLTRLRFEGVGYNPFNPVVGTPTPTPTATPTPEPVNADFSYSCDPCTAPALFTFSNESSGATSYSWDFGDGGSSAAISPSHVYAAAGTYTVELTATGTSGSDTYSIEITVTGAGVPGEGSLYQPLSLNDRFGTLPFFDRQALIDYNIGNIPNPLTPYENQVVAMSNRAGDHVYSIAGGLVISIAPASSCSQLGLTSMLGRCVEMAAHPDLPGGAKGFAISLDGVWIVRIGFDTGRDVYYAVADADQYLTEGAEITGGCIVGTTIPTDPIVTSVNILVEADLEIVDVGGSIGGNVDLFDQLAGFAFISLQDTDGDREPLLDQLTAPPLDDRACNINPENASCIGDPTFDRPENWQRQGDVRWNYLYDTVELYPNARIWQTVSLSELLAYSFRVDLQSQGASGSVLLEIGNTAEEFIIGSQSTFQVAASVHEPNADGTYRVSITNTGYSRLSLTENCVSRGTPSTLPNTCLFANYGFDNGTTSWTVTGDVFQEARGELIFTDDSGIAQNIELWPDGASAYEYLLTVKARPIGFPNAASNTTDSISIEYRYGSGDWLPLNPQGSIPLPVAAFYGNQVNNILYFENDFRLFSGYISVSSFANDSLQLRVQIDAAADGLVGITEACIDDDFGTFPGTTGGGTTGTGAGNPQPVFGYTCNVISRPQSVDIGPWIAFLWSSLDRFFQCDLMRAINTIINGIIDALNLAWWALSYFQETITRMWTWIGQQLIPYLNAHFNNIVLARGGVGGGESCGDIFCLLTTLINAVVSLLQPLVDAVAGVIGLLTQGLSLLFDLIGSLLNLFVVLITQIFNLFNQVRDLLSRLVDAWNTATPTPIPGVPVCNADPRSSPTCMVFWFVDNTILSGRGALIVPVVIGVAAANLILWAIKKLKDGLGEAARAA